MEQRSRTCMSGLCNFGVLNYAAFLTGFSQSVASFFFFFFFCRHDGTDSPADAGDVIVTLNSFHSKIIKVRVSVLSTRGLFYNRY